MSNKSSGFVGDLTNWARGLCMGAADIVPGVSGGTMALILGHYERLIRAISRIDTKFLGMLASRDFARAALYIDLRFLLGLVAGIGSGILGLASLMHYLLEHQQAYTYAVFFGLILASSYLVTCRLKKWTPACIVTTAVGAVAAWQLCILNPGQTPLTPLTAFAAATIAICAMILPGISGAFVLLLFGLYHPITSLIKGIPHGEFTADGLYIIAAFGAGCGVGLLSFTRLLKWMLAHKHDITMAFLVGLMLGSLVKIWPYQRVTAATAELPFKDKRFELMWPTPDIANLAWVIGLAVLAGGLTLLLEFAGKRLSAEITQPSCES